MNTIPPISNECPEITREKLVELWNKFTMPQESARKVMPATDFEWKFIETLYREGWKAGASEGGSRSGPFHHRHPSALELFGRFVWLHAFDCARFIKGELRKAERLADR